MTSPEYSIVIPVFRSADVVGATVHELLETMATERVEVVLVDDGSPDDSWQVIRMLAESDDRVVALKLLRNFGQHHANLAGFSAAKGEWVVTMDDDGQNPPSEIAKLRAQADTGHDVVFGRLETKRASLIRRLGSRAVSAINRRVFHQPEDLAISNFRLIHRSVVDRIVADRTPFPYISGQALIHSANPGDTLVEHRSRDVGTSTYSPRKILKLLFNILFSYSVWPLRAAAALGFVVAGLSLVAALAYFVLALTGRTQVEGWATLVVLVALLGGVTIAQLSMLGEYILRIMLGNRDLDRFEIVERVGIVDA